MNKAMTAIWAGAVCVLLCNATASADIHTFWRTDVCPVLGGQEAIAQELGRMESSRRIEDMTGIGGPYCRLDSATEVTRPWDYMLQVARTDLGPHGPVDPPLVAWACVVCQYATPTGSMAIPTLSLLGTAVLMGGLVTAAIYELRRRRCAIAES